jgi:FkbM family methyltransferase
MQFTYTQYWDEKKRLRPRTECIELVHDNPEDHIMRSIAESKTFYEIDLLEYAAACGPRGGVFIDVGANIGNHSVYFSKFLADAAIAIEPSLRALKCLRRNISLNNITNCVVVECAVGETCTEGELVLPVRLKRNLGGSRVKMLSDGKLLGEDVFVESRVLVRPLDDIVREFQTVANAGISLIKIDVEGMELSVLKGARDVLERHKPDICTEAWSDSNRDAISDFLNKYGYSCTRVIRVGTPSYWFVHDSKRESRRGSGWLVRKLIASWSRGRLSAFRRLLDRERRLLS